MLNKRSAISKTISEERKYHLACHVTRSCMKHGFMFSEEKSRHPTTTKTKFTWSSSFDRNFVQSWNL